jgi:hypothetical protein
VYKWRLSFRSTPEAAAALHASINRGICSPLPKLCNTLLEPFMSGAYVTSWFSTLKLGSTSSMP